MITFIQFVKGEIPEFVEAKDDNSEKSGQKNGTVEKILNVLIPRGFDKNPLLALFDLYEFPVPLSTKGWIFLFCRPFTTPVPTPCSKPWLRDAGP